MVESNDDGSVKQLSPPQMERVEHLDPLRRIHMLECCLILEVPVVGFNIGSLVRLEAGSIIKTAAQHNEDLQLQVNGQIVGSVKFDVTGDRLAVRLTGVA